MPSKSEKQAKTMTAACKSAKFRKKVDISKKVACDFHDADKGTYHKEDVNMSEELNRIKKLAGVKEPVAEKIELNASDNEQKDARADDVSQAMQMAKLKRKMEDRDGDDADFKGLFTGVARGEISLDDKGKIAEATFGIIKSLEEACGKKHKKKMEEESTEELEEGSEERKSGRKAAGQYGRPGTKEQKRAASKDSRKKGKKATKDLDEYAPPTGRWGNMSASEIENVRKQFSNSEKAPPEDFQKEYKKRKNKSTYHEDDTSPMFPKDSLERIMVEMIVDEMKTGKNAEEISEELAFSLEHVEPIYDILKKKFTKGIK